MISTMSTKEFLDRMKTADGVMAVDSEQRIAYLNPAAELLLGCSAEEAIGRPCQEVVRGLDPDGRIFCRQDCAVMRQCKGGGLVPAYDITLQTPQGETCRLNTSIVTLESPEDGSPLVTHFFRDVTPAGQPREAEQSDSAGLDRAADGADCASAAPRLSRRETDVLALLAQGMSNSSIADVLYISPITARNHVDRIMAKFGVENRLQAVLFATQHGLV
jgi:PAS domain S-box-containing protein